jgi:probable rRNA maturation factor
VAVHVTSGNPLLRAFVARRARAMLRHLRLQKAELSIVLTTDRQIQKLNKLYRKKNKPTDVLSFPMREGKFGERAGALLGDIIISIPTARRQASEKGVSMRAEVTELLAHGLLHLLGWDHRTDAEDRAMRRETARLVSGSQH